MMERVAILGTGLLGTSVGLALRAAGFRGSIIGWNRRAEGAQVALKSGAIDSIATDPISAAREADVTILSVPIYATLDLMAQITMHVGGGPSHHRRRQHQSFRSPKLELSTSTRWAALLFSPVIPWQARSGAAQSSATRTFSAAQRGSSPTRPVQSAHLAAKNSSLSWREWVVAMGSKVIDIDAARHDELVAWVSHLPQFTATALSALLENEVGDAPELNDVGGRALREMTRLGASPFSMWRDIAHTNTDAIAAALQALEQTLAHIRENLRTPELRDEFEKANRFRRE